MHPTTYLLALDQGTTSSRALIYACQHDGALQLIAQAKEEFPQHYPQASWVEHDLEEIWRSLASACTRAFDEAKSLVPSFRPEQLAAIGITNQRETLCVFDRQSSRPLCRAIVWQCKRSSAICAGFSAAEKETIISKTGLQVDPYFTASKITWIMENNPSVAAALRKNSAVVGTIDCYLMHRLSAGKSFVTEASNASRTMLYNLAEGCWDEELCRLFKLPSTAILPELRDSAGIFAHTKGVGFLPDGIPVSGVLGDQQAALAGQLCFSPGESKCTYGTGAFLLCQLGEKPLRSRARILTTVSWSLAGKRSYALEGSAFIAGAAVHFLRDNLKIIANSREASLLAPEVQAAPEIYFVPALAGLGAPWWNPEAKGAVFGLTRATTREQIILATLEGVALQVCDLLIAMAADMPGAISTVRVDGGASSNDRLLQLQADLANVQIERSAHLESTAFGAAIFAALGCGIMSSLEGARKSKQAGTIFTPAAGTEAAKNRSAKLAGWRRSISAVQKFHEGLL
jgi:glycerol kinase